MTFDFFSCIIASLAGNVGRFDALTIDDPSAGMGISPFCFTQLGSQNFVDPLPQSTFAPSVIIMRNGAVRRQISWQISPCTSISIEVEDRVQDFSSAVLDFASQVFWTW